MVYCRYDYDDESCYRVYTHSKNIERIKRLFSFIFIVIVCVVGCYFYAEGGMYLE